MIEVRNLRVRRGKREVVHDVSLTVPTGSWLSVVGPNGAGKSSLLRAIAGLVPSAGTVGLDGRALGSLTAKARARRIALVPQEPLLPEALTVAEYVLLGRTPHLSMFGT